ncbi:MAG: S8 family serine peptidase, partial [Actinomycetota bacterium]|nr:S8 family serine peptidase [Actinomycetota bacterium]
VVATGARTAGEALAQLRADPRVATATPDRVRTASVEPNDTFYVNPSPAPNQRADLAALRVPQAWDRGKGHRSVTVAVLDTGVDLDHPDLVNKILPGNDVVNDDALADDDEGHGTFVAGLAAAQADNAQGIAGVAWYSRIIPVKVLGANGSGSDSDVVEGIIWATDHGAHVINLSLGGPGASPALDAAVDYALDNDVVVVAAAGNEGSDEPSYPAASPGAIAVGATNSAGALTSFSNFGDWVDVVAPGSGVLSTTMGGSYGSGSGTSFASPLTAGVAVLVRWAYPDLDARGVTERLLATTRDVGAQGWDSNTGKGMVDAAAALGAPRRGGAVPVGDGSEPSGTPAAATLLPVSAPAQATISPEGDVDWFKVALSAPATLTVTVGATADLAPVVTAYDQRVRKVGEARTGDSNGPVVRQPVSLSIGAGAGTYRFEVANDVGSASSEPYSITATITPASSPSTAGEMAWVRATAPATFASGVATGTQPFVDFLRNVDPSSVTAGNFLLVGGLSGRVYSSSVTWNPALKRVVVTPAAPLRAGLPYVIVVRGVRDTGGQTLPGRYRLRFTTAP